ncbi:methylenetetrahydrofolate reductase [NAD(P)H] [Eupransor demetentiae]|uniref:Methylenetetrahydrofolate reductase n=1 Tax=Eupransor demetentiae TaxID=3109584 RepID=A0ABM9N5I1_9LACO|nr:5 [Lactobacillaceae bacterium LMG 33000] [Lactobacillaceae bacterium LMG 33000]
MALSELFKDKTVFSLEIFPPKTPKGRHNLIQALTGIQSIQPDFISITQSAAAGFSEQATLQLASQIQNDLNIPSVAHIPCLYHSKEEVADYLEELKAHGVENILALRGDACTDKPAVGDFRYASDLVEFIKGYGDFDVSGAAYPQKHPESDSVVSDTLYLKEKVQKGASHLITQMVFDNQDYWDFKQRLDLAGIHVPVEVGIMPCTNLKQIKRITEMSGIKLPRKFIAIMDRYADNPVAMRDAGIAYAIDQIVDLIANGVDGIHLYTMNNMENTQRIWEATHNLFQATQSSHFNANQTTQEDHYESRKVTL